MEIRKRMIIGVIAAVVILLIGYGFWPKPFVVETSEVRDGPLKVTVEEEGRTRVMDRFVVTAPVSGLALRIDLNVGDSVYKDRPILYMEPVYSEVLGPRRQAEAQARVRATEAALKAAKETVKAAKSDADLAESEWERIKGLFDAGSATRQMLDHAQADNLRASSNLSSSNFAVEVARYDYEAAKTALEYYGIDRKNSKSIQIPITSPVDGCVLKINHESEGIVQVGQPLIEVGNPRTLEIETDVLSSDAVKILPGTRVELDRWGGNELLQGRVRTIEPVGFTKYSALGVEEQRVLVITDIISPKKEWNRLGDGYRVVTRFVIWEKDSVLQVPTSALFRKDGKWAVFVIRNNRATIRGVEIGHRSGLTAEIQSGIMKDDRVIIHPDEQIEDGARVSVR